MLLECGKPWKLRIKDKVHFRHVRSASQYEREVFAQDYDNDCFPCKCHERCHKMFNKTGQAKAETVHTFYVIHMQKHANA